MMTVHQLPAPPASTEASLGMLLGRLLERRDPAAAETLRGWPAADEGGLVRFVREHTPLRAARVESFPHLARTAGRGVCAADTGVRALVAVADNGGCLVEAGPGELRVTSERAVAPLFPATLFHLPPEPLPGPSEPGPDEPESGGLGVSVYLRLLAQLLGLSTPIAMLIIIDKVVNDGASNTLAVLVMGVALLTVFQYLFLAAGTAHAAREAVCRAGAERARQVAALINCREGATWASAGWEAIQSCADAATFAVETRAQCLADVWFVVMLAGLMGAFSVSLLGVSLAFVPVYLGLTIWSGERSRALARALADDRGALAGRYQEAVAAPETVRGLALGSHFAARWERHDRVLSAHRYRLMLWQRLGAQGVEFLQRLSLIVIMLLGVSMVIAGTMTLGQYIAFNLLAMQLAPPLLRLAAYHRARGDQQLGLRTRQQLLAAVAERRWPAGGARDLPVEAPRVELAGVRLRHGPGGAPPLHLTLRGGMWLGITGASGSGKSTLLRTVGGLCEPADGVVRINGLDVASLEPVSLAACLRLVPQQPVLFAGSIGENIRLGDLSASPAQVLTAARVCGIERLDIVLSGAAAGLSGGERQRIALARAIVCRPRVLLLDEATAALDATGEAAVLDALRHYLPRAAVAVVAHRPSSLVCCDQVVDLQAALTPSRVAGR